MGTGHVMRMLALAQAWRDAGGEVTFVLARSTPAVEEILVREGIRILHIVSEPGSMDDAGETLSLLGSLRPVWVVLDGYHFLSQYQRRIRDAGFHLLFIDDYGHAPPYSADIILNQNISAVPVLYTEREPHTRLALGTRYVLLRREFLEWPATGRGLPDAARNILVTFGGSDPDNATGSVLEAVEESNLQGINLTVVVGFANRHAGDLESTVRHSKTPMRIITGAMNMPELMAGAHIAFSGGGTTCWELIHMGVPSIVIELAENQHPIASELGRRGIIQNLGDIRNITRELISTTLENMVRNYPLCFENAQKMRSLVDGEGTARVMAMMHRISGEKE